MPMQSLIYLDNAATTKPLPGLGELFARYTENLWFNPSALYGDAVEVRRAVESARDRIAAVYGSPEHRCTFTSGGTEAANMAIRFGARKKKNMNYVCAGLEHPCVEESFKALQESGADVRFANVQPDGSTSIESVMNLVDRNTALVSVMHVSNETGAVNDIARIASAVKSAAPGAMFHSDGVQAFCRVPVGRPDLIDYYTVSSHKIHGLKGTGAVLSRKGTPLREMLRGGGQEKGLRSGTENVFGIIAFAEAAKYFADHRGEIDERLRALSMAVMDGIEPDPDIVRVVSAAPHIVSLYVRGVRGETLMHSLESDNVIIATGSACSSSKGRDRIARALRISKDEAASMIRLSFCPDNTVYEVREALHAIQSHAAQLRSMLGG